MEKIESGSFCLNTNSSEPRKRGPDRDVRVHTGSSQNNLYFYNEKTP